MRQNNVMKCWLWQKRLCVAKAAAIVALLVAEVLFAACDDDEESDVCTIQASYAGASEDLFSVQLITEDGDLAGFVVTTGESVYEAVGDEWYIWDESDDGGVPVVYHVWVWLDESGAAWYEWEQVSLEEAAGDIEAVSVWVHVAEDDESADADDSEEDESVALSMIVVTTSSGECLSWWLDRSTVSFTVTDDETGESASYTISVCWCEGSLVYEVEE